MIDKNFSNVIINVNSNKKNKFIMDHFFINGLFSVGEKTIIDNNIELFLNANLKVFIVIEKKYFNLLSKNLINSSSVEIIIKEFFDLKNLDINNHEKILLIDDNFYFDENSLNYFLTNEKYKNKDSLITLNYNSYSDLVAIFSKELLSYVDFKNNSINEDIKFNNHINQVVENKNTIAKVYNYESLLNLDPKYGNDENFIYFTPGPVEVRPMVKMMLGNYINHHRSLSIKHIYKKAAENIKWAFNSKNGFPIAMLNTGLGAIESCFINLLTKDDDILILSNGFFGNYLINIAKRYELNVSYLETSPAESFDINEIEKLMINKKAVFMVHMDTSCGVLNPIKEVGALCKKYNCLFIVDAISTILNETFDFDNYNITAAVSTSVKGFEVCAGLAFICVSQKGMEISLNNNRAKPMFLDWMTFQHKSLTNGITPSTYPVNIFATLNAVCDEIKENGGISRLIDQKFNLNLYLSENLLNMGFSHVVLDENARSNWVIVLRTPEGIGANELRSYLYVVKNILIECGIADDSDRIIRLAISASHDIESAQKLIEAISEFIDSKN